MLQKDQMKKALVCYIIEQTLVEMGGLATLNTVAKILDEKFHCTVLDCYERPIYLSRALSEIYGNAHTKVIQTINEKLDEFSYQKSIRHFMHSLQP